jgi:UTP--glucose-1-phosphate uridylyltransferase
MMESYEQTGGNVVAVDPIPMELVSSYGVIAHEPAQGRSMKITGMVEKPPMESAPSNLRITGRYILQPEIFGLLENQERGAGGEIQLTDAMRRLMESQDFWGFRFEGRDYDCGSRLGYAQAYVAYALKDPELGNDVRTVIEALLKA